jgi:hypothetical protein
VARCPHLSKGRTESAWMVPSLSFSFYPQHSAEHL